MMDEKVFEEGFEDEEFATPEEMKEEAIKRMKKLGIIWDAVRQFKNEGIVMVSEPPFGGLYWYHDEEENFNKMKEFEKENGALVYMVVRAWTNFGKMDSYLYVSKYKEEWDMDNEDIDDNIVMTYTVNYDMPDCSEFGSIGVRKVSGGLLRTA